MVSLIMKKKIIVLAVALILLSSKQKKKRFEDNSFAVRSVNDILASENPTVCRDSINMLKDCFISLLLFIKENINLDKYNFTRIMPIEVKLFIGIQFLTKGIGIRQQSSEWRLSYDSIKRCRDTTIDIICQCYKYLVRWDLVDDLHYNKIDNNARYKIFGNAIGCMDGTHIKCIVNDYLSTRFRCRHNYTSTNTLLVCNFNMLFLYSLAGCEGKTY